jgi:spore coat polysaccharide biosynthesis protein SpsF (cytidylyltransferase family)
VVERRPVVVAVEATTSATSPRGLILEDLGGRPALELLLERLEPLRSLASATVALVTTDLASDDPIAELGRRHDLPVVRHAEGDVIDGLAVAAVRTGAELVVRVVATGPLADPFVILAALQLHRAAEAAVTTNLLPRSYPAGLEVEVLGAAALRAAALEATDPDDRRDPTAHVVRRPERFRLANLDSGHDAATERWTLDDLASLDALRELVGQLADPTTASWNRILAIVGRRVRPVPDQLRLVPLPGPEPGSSPWVRRWRATVNGRDVGVVSVGVGEGSVTRDVAVEAAWVEPAREALYRLLLHDAQARP